MGSSGEVLPCNPFCVSSHTATRPIKPTISSRPDAGEPPQDRDSEVCDLTKSRLPGGLPFGSRSSWRSCPPVSSLSASVTLLSASRPQIFPIFYYKPAKERTYECMPPSIAVVTIALPAAAATILASSLLAVRSSEIGAFLIQGVCWRRRWIRLNVFLNGRLVRP
jgi:hypothetical protein